MHVVMLSELCTYWSHVHDNYFIWAGSSLLRSKHSSCAIVIFLLYSFLVWWKWKFKTFSQRVENLLHLQQHLSSWCYSRHFTLGTIEFFVIRKLLPPTHRAEQSVITHTHFFILLLVNIPVSHLVNLCLRPVYEILWATSWLFYFALKRFSPLLLFFLSLLCCIRFPVFLYHLLY